MDQFEQSGSWNLNQEAELKDSIYFKNTLINLIFNLEKFLQQNETDSEIDINSIYTEFIAKRDIHLLTKKLVSCQIVIYGTIFDSPNSYKVYNYCHKLEDYIQSHEVYFNNPINKSLLPIFDENFKLRSQWYFSRQNCEIKSERKFSLKYEENIVPAIYEEFGSYNECLNQWTNWANLILNLYEEAQSVFATNLDIHLDKNFKVVSGIFLGFSCNLTGFEKIFVHRICQEALTNISQDNLLPNLYQHATRQTTRAAISQVMARNMSHNIGSHVSYKATNIAIKKRINELYPAIDLNTVNLTDQRKLAEFKAVIDWIDFMSEKLDKYEIHRNEYLADYSLSPQSFLFYKDVILPFCENTLILDNIASMEGANYPKTNGDKENGHSKQNKLRIRVFIKKEGENSYKEIRAKYPDLNCLFSGDDCEAEIIYPDNFLYLLKNKEEKNSISDGINSKKIEEPDLDVEIILHSEQGLYSILENFIRNSAKHNKDKIKEIGSLEIRLHLEEQDDRFSLIISDNVSKLVGEQLYNESTQNLGLFQRMKSGVIANAGQAGKQNLGFADMNINSFLFRYNPSDISNETLTKNLHLLTIKGDEYNLEVGRVNGPLLDSNEYKFGYQLKLLKPRKILWIGEDIFINDGNEKISSLKKSGIFHSFSVDEYTKNTARDNEIAAFDFIVFYKDFNYSQYLENQIHFPARVLVKANADTAKHDKPNIQYVESDFSNIKDANKLLERCWIEWLNRIDQPKKAFIYYDKISNENVERLSNIELKNNNSIKCVNLLEEETSISEDEFAIIYDHHGNAIDEENSFLVNPVDKNFYLYHSKILFDKGSDDFVSLNYLSDNDFNNKLLAYKLIDAASTNVFILDERISTVASQNKTIRNDKEIGLGINKYNDLNFSRFCYGKVFAINNININGTKEKPILQPEQQKYYLSLQINTEDKDLEIKIDSENQEIKNVLGKINALRKDIMIIHRTYLKKEILEMEVKDFLDLAGEIFGSVIVTSGGGYPHNLSKDVRFVPFSIIEQCINSRLSKLKLVTYLQKLQYVK